MGLLVNLTRFEESLIKLITMVTVAKFAWFLSIMGLLKYNRTIHPGEWLKQVQTFCYLKEITNGQKILQIYKLIMNLLKLLNLI